MKYLLIAMTTLAVLIPLRSFPDTIDVMLSKQDDTDTPYSKHLAQGNKTAPAASRKNVIVLFNFAVKGEPEKHEYYTYIIPQTIGKNLTATGKYTIHRIIDRQPSESDGGLFASAVNDAALKHGADYVVTGAVEVMPASLTVNMKIHDVKSGGIRDVRSSSSEVGALLKDAIDECSAGVEGSLAEMVQQNITAKESPEPGGSPFLRFYNSLSGLSFGIEGGRFFITKQWDGGFNDGYFVRSYIEYRFFPKFALSISLDYLSTDNFSDTEPDPSQLTQWIPSLVATIYLPSFSIVHPFFSIGGGVAFTEIVHKQASITGPLDSSTETVRSRDPYMSMSAGARFVIHPVILSFGASFENTFIFGENFRLFTLFGGIGYRF